VIKSLKDKIKILKFTTLGFTLVELLAVIVILAIILAIAVPSITGIIHRATIEAFNSDAKMVLKAIDYKLLENPSYNYELLDRDKIETDLELGNNNYESISVSMKDNKPYIIIVGQNKWSDLVACGTYTNMIAGDGSECDIPAFSGQVDWLLNEETETLTAIVPEVIEDNVEYRVNEGLWQESNVFLDLEPNTEYIFEAKVKNLVLDEKIEVISPSIYNVTINASPTEGGSIEPSLIKILSGNKVSPTITTNEGYNFIGLNLISGNASINQENEIINIQSDVVIEAEFDIVFYTIHYESTAGATLEPTFRTVAYGSDSIVPEITIEEGYEFSHFTIIDGVGNGELNLETGLVTNVTGNMTIQVSFVLSEYNVSYTASTGGSVTTSDTVVTHGGSTGAVSYTTNTGYNFVNFSIISGGGNATLNEETGALTNIIGHITIQANFELKEYTVTYNGNGGSCTPSSRLVNYGSPAAVPSCSRADYDLTGFTITSGSCASGWNANTGYCASVTEAITIRANWETSWTCGVDKLIDERNGQYEEYVTTQIGDQCWMAENLRYISNGCLTMWEDDETKDNYAKGCMVVQASELESDEEWAEGEVHYQWEAAMNSCPPGWHIPTHDEWTTLERYICNDSGNSNCKTKFPNNTTTTGWCGTNEGTKIKSKNHWSPTGTDDYGLNLLPNGYRLSRGPLRYVGTNVNWWSSSLDDVKVWVRYLRSIDKTVGRTSTSQGGGHPARCVKD
jgi:uncharacterized protein (TIGR02145 family)/prepilin-type N-terminal cleavage/methylation domain-containing protein